MSLVPNEDMFQEDSVNIFNAAEDSGKIRAEKPLVCLASKRPLGVLRTAVFMERRGQKVNFRELNCEQEVRAERPKQRCVMCLYERERKWERKTKVMEDT